MPNVEIVYYTLENGYYGFKILIDGTESINQTEHPETDEPLTEQMAIELAESMRESIVKALENPSENPPIEPEPTPEEIINILGQQVAEVKIKDLEKDIIIDTLGQELTNIKLQLFMGGE